MNQTTHESNHQNLKTPNQWNWMWTWILGGAIVAGCAVAWMWQPWKDSAAEPVSVHLDAVHGHDILHAHQDTEQYAAAHSHRTLFHTGRDHGDMHFCHANPASIHRAHDGSTYVNAVHSDHHVGVHASDVNGGMPCSVLQHANAV